VSNKSVSIIIGASGGIGQATLQYCLRHKVSDSVVAISRQPSNPVAQHQSLESTWLQADTTQDSIKAAVDHIKQIGLPSEIFICTGFLHDEKDMPEKRIENFNDDLWLKTAQANTVLPLLWLKHLMPLLIKTDVCKISVLSARVGSIDDNSLGGWYSYRASKSALNMLLKTAAIEFSRRAKGVKLISFHPGTTDTGLSKPFQKNVPSNKLFNADFVAQRLVDITRKTNLDNKLSFIDWDNKPIKW